jgi:hypothetical protein
LNHQEKVTLEFIYILILLGVGLGVWCAVMTYENHQYLKDIKSRLEEETVSGTAQ